VIVEATLWSQWSLPKGTRTLTRVLSLVRDRKLGGQHDGHYVMRTRWSREGLGADRDRSDAHCFQSTIEENDKEHDQDGDELFYILSGSTPSL
jgi:hypothetical protein